MWRRAAATSAAAAAAAWRNSGRRRPVQIHQGRLNTPRPASTLTGLGPLPERRRATRTVAVALSGGVDSAIAAARLLECRRRGDEVFAVHLRTWDAADEGGGVKGTGEGGASSPSTCTADADEAAARGVARALGLDLVTLDAVADYWCDVFAPFASSVAAGLTPNPDLACNALLKFGSVVDRVVGGMGADALATGHYARVRWRSQPHEVGHDDARDAADALADPWAARPWDSSSAPASPHSPALLMGADPLKDQSYFLATVPGPALRSALFPVGGLRKDAVRGAAAAHPGLSAALAGRRSSAGICFVGRRRFGEFMEGYADPVPGLFRGVGDAGVRVNGEGRAEGGNASSPSSPLPFAAASTPCPNTWALTHGQRAPIGGARSKLYVVGKDGPGRTVWVAPGRHHPSLFCGAAALGPFAWVGGAAPAGLSDDPLLPLTYRARYRQPPRACVLEPWEAARGGGAAFAASSYSRTEPSLLPPPAWVVRFGLPARAITPAQALVLYSGEECLGAAPVVAPGASLWEGGTETVPAAAVDAAAAEGEAGWRG